MRHIEEDAIKRSLNQFQKYVSEHNYNLNRPLFDLWLTNKFWGTLTSGADEAELQELQEAKDKLIEYNKLHQFMSYCSDLSDRTTLLMNREFVNDPTNPLSIYRSSPHNEIDSLFPEIEGIIGAYYEVVDTVRDDPEWLYKVEAELGSHIAFLATSFCETSRDQLVEKSDVYKRFDMDKQKFFK
eukprot:CAMPEP_0197004016 /NCGR_PEP_ID=MMETSP1380-20130617/17525_1 /TAXON_ID=5936 /ORGANISM="Euplotes crassus, Strain CT5" /LENGTH=183 /DNA_ID=CAMNT_0042422657 /DNA_START=85 /DNA_END=637 /DNA_ORIENTATION=+